MSQFDEFNDWMLQQGFGKVSHPPTKFPTYNYPKTGHDLAVCVHCMSITVQSEEGLRLYRIRLKAPGYSAARAAVREYLEKEGVADVAK